MEFQNEFSVAAPLDQVWTTLLDIERVAPCFPGARVLERNGPDQYSVAMRVRVGPITMQYQGELKVIETDQAEHRAVLGGSARETRGQGAAEARAEMRLHRAGDQTVASIATDVKLSGRVAAMGQGVIGDVAKRLVDTFSTNLGAMLMAPAAGPEQAASPGAIAQAPQPALRPPLAVGDDDALPVLSLLWASLLGRLRQPRVALAAGGVAAVLLGLRAWRKRR